MFSSIKAALAVADDSSSSKAIAKLSDVSDAFTAWRSMVEELAE